MRRLLFFFGLLSTTALAQQAVPPLGTAALVCAYNTSIPVPVAGTFAYVQCDANGKLITSGAGGGITGPGTTVSGNLVTWNSATGAAIADSGIAASNIPTFSATATGVYSGSLEVYSAAQYNGFLVNNATNWIVKLQGVGTGNDNGTLALFNAGTQGVQIRSSGYSYLTSSLSIGAATNTYPLDVTGNIRTTTGLLINGSTVIDTIQSGNTSAQARTITFPNTGNATDTLALLAAGQTFSGANTFSGTTTLSGTTQFSGNGPSSGPAANTTWVQGGSTAPTPGSNAGVLTIGGLRAAGTLSTAGQGDISLSASNGLQLQGNPQISFIGTNGSVFGYVSNTGLYTRAGLSNGVTGHVWTAVNAPTITSGFGTVQGSLGTQNGTFRFDVNTNVGGTSGVVGLTSATTDWMCKAQSKNNAATLQVIQTGYGPSSATFAPYTLAGVLSAWVASDVIAISCVAN